ncbi:hypothetical protein C7820_6182 [Paenibacillus sp. VMFN-D1]|nr:hypothetical protein C7820_6182 [Paenibacillus sp. VMFN-D1]
MTGFFYTMIIPNREGMKPSGFIPFFAFEPRIISSKSP